MRVALALGSGGARGYAHIGVIRELEARGHEVVGLTGASMGAIVGALYAADRLDDFEEWVRGLNQRDVLRLLDVSFAGGGAIRANKLMGVIRGMLDDARIEDLRIPYTAVATDIRARREVWFTRGPVDLAVRASFAIPSVVTPAVVGGRLMVDGGVTNPVPLEPLASVESDLVLAVSLTGRRSGLRGSTFQESSDPAEPTREADPTLPGPGDVDGDDGRDGGRSGRRGGTGKLTGRIRTAAADVRDAELVRLIASRFGLDGAGELDDGEDASGEGRPDIPSAEVEEAVEEGVDGVAEQADDRALGELPASLRIFDVATQSIEAMESIIAGYRMAGSRPDVLVEVPSDSCSAFDFHRADEIIDLGRRLTVEALDRAGV